MNGQFLYGTSHTICTPHMKPFYCSVFKIWDINYDLEGYKDPISNKYKKWMVSSYMGRPILYAHLIWNHFTAAFLRYGTLFDLEGIKTPFLISTRNEWSVLIWTSHTICTPHMKSFYCSVLKIWDIIRFRGTINTPFLISTRNEWSVLIWDVPYYMHTSYETILLQRFQDMGH